jgi:putative AdoMet-dependent methyltransferase
LLNNTPNTAMSQINRTQLFDTWAKNYHPGIASAEDAFPFAGYDQVLDEVVRIAAVTPGMRLLDLGIGTGNLAKRFLPLGCEVWGVDFSTEMLAQTNAKFPQIHLVKANLMGEWPDKLGLFDCIVSAYVFHEFDLATKINLLQNAAAHHLYKGGRIVIADVAFPTAALRTEASRRWTDVWDEDEYYWAADEAITAAAQVGLHMEYRQGSTCGGVFVVASKGSISL